MSKCHIVGNHMSRLICHSKRSNKDELYIFKIFLKVVHRISGKAKTLILSTNVDQKSLETGFSIAICRPIFRFSKTLFLAISICIKQHVFVRCYIFELIKADSFPFL